MKEKETEKEINQSVINMLEMTVNYIPGPIYWKNKNGVYLGMNEFALAITGFKSFGDIIGKNDYDLWPQFAQNIIQNDQKVLRTGLPLHTQESIIQPDGKIIYFTAVKAPLRDENGNIIGIIGNSLDITDQKRKQLEYLEKLAPSMPGPIYWKDKNSIYLGMNEFTLKVTGIKSFADFIGKSDYDLWPQFADQVVSHDQEVMRTGKALHKEEAITLPTGEIRYFTVIKVPLHDDDGNIIGIIGNSIDITAQKEAESLKIENETQKILIEEQEKFAKLANKVAHDIRSPISTLTSLVKECRQIPEDRRIALREAAIGIGDIANHLLQQYEKEEKDPAKIEERELILVSMTLLEILTRKKYEYKALTIKFDHHFEANSYFAFIKIGPSAFKRTLSNLINNAVDALENTGGKVDLTLEANNEWVKIKICDNGKGMPKEVKDKIMNKTAVTQGKKEGHGIGLTQVWETLDNNHGELHIDSESGKGTSITLAFPRMSPPAWFAEEIILHSDDLVVILDDDTSIHSAWRMRFEGILNETHSIQLKHFEQAHEGLEFVNALPALEKAKVFLLTDYEFLEQELNGLHVIARSGIKRSLLVTSHYANLLIQADAMKRGTKILPKQLASEIPITIVEKTSEANVPIVDLIIVDDDPTFTNTLVRYVFRGLKVEVFNDPHYFLEQVARFPKSTKIYLDNNYDHFYQSGIDIAKELHELGYERLYLLSGDYFAKGELPDYLTAIPKEKIDEMKDL